MPNPCSFCHAECCKTYTITTTIFDIIRIAKARCTSTVETSGSAEGPLDKNSLDYSFAALHEPRLLSYDSDCVIDTVDGFGYYLLGIASHPCILLNTKTNRCTVHKDAPLSCRRYPFMLNGKHNLRFCPLASSFLYRFRSPDIDTKQLIQELALHKSFVKEWNKNPGKKADVLGFMLSRAEQII